MLPTIKLITFEGQLCNTLSDLWTTLHSLYNAAANCPINPAFLNDLP